MRLKRYKTITAAILIGTALGISAGALSAYMTSSETATNTFTAGEVKIDLQEPAWKPEDGKHLVAKQTVLKDPKIRNTGKNPAYVFMTVQVPVRTLTLYNDAGRKEEYSETTELFNLKKNVNGNYETLSDTNSGNWVLLKDRSTYATKDESFTTYVYAYRVPVEPNATSDALFDAVQLKNVIEGYSEMSKISTKDEYPITINGYAIQATDVIGADGSDVTDGTVTTDDLLRMYDTYVNQNGTGTGSSMNLMTDPSTQYKDGKMVIPELPKKTGYKNDGLWHDDNGHTYAAGTEVTVTDEMKQNGFNLHVNWEPITYTVRFNSNGGSGTMEDLTMTYDEAAALPTNAFTKGTNFFGWSLSQTGSINFKDGAMIRNLSETDGDTVTLYALWKQNKFKVTYNANGGYFGTDTSKISNAVTYQNEKQLIQKTSKTDNVNEDGSGYSGSYGNNVNKTEVVAIPGASELKVTITYQTESTSYDWVCMWEGAHPEYTAKDNDSSSKTGKLGGSTKATKEYTVTGDSVTFAFRSDGSGSNYFGYYAVVEGEGIVSTVKTGTFMQPSHLENLFVGWYTNAACTDGHEFSPEGCESDTTVYAKWREPVATLKEGPHLLDTTLSDDLAAIAVDRATITTFKRSETMPDISAMTDANIISSDNSEVPIYCWKDGTELKYWSKAKKINAGTTLYGLFSGYKQLSDISGLSCWNTENVEYMHYMFHNCNSLTDLTPLSSWNTGNVDFMSSMFSDCSSLADLTPISSWDTENVINTEYMFDNCKKLTVLPSWNIGNKASMISMFSDCSSLADLTPLSSWNTRNVTNMEFMFDNCSSLTDLTPLSSWNTGNVTSMSFMFHGCSSLTDITSLFQWNTEKVKNMADMFDGCSSLTDITALSSWNTGKATAMYSMFSGCSSLTDLTPLSSWNTGNVTNMSYMFDKCSSITNLTGLSSWDTKNVTNMAQMFGYCKSLKDLTPLSSWNTGNVTDMSAMFSGCNNLTDINGLSSWNTRNVTTMGGEDNKFRGIGMFKGCSSLTDLTPLSLWNTGNVTNMSYMFDKCRSLTDLTPLSSWNTESVTDMCYMFQDCNSLTDASGINDWDISNVTSFSWMFSRCPSHPTFTKRAGTWDGGGTFTPAA